MTAIVGVLCHDGAVVGTDSSVTFTGGSVRTIEQPAEKLHLIGERVLLAGTGFVGHGQRFHAIIEAGVQDKMFSRERTPIDVCKELSRKAIEDFLSTHSPKGLYGALVAFPLGRDPVLCEFGEEHFQPGLLTKQIWYCSMGSAQPITDPFLALMREIFWSSGPPSVNDATFAVTWALDHAIAVNPGGVNGPVRIAVLERSKKGLLSTKLLVESDLDEHRSSIQEAKNRLSKFPEELRAVNRDDLDVPRKKTAGR